MTSSVFWLVPWKPHRHWCSCCRQNIRAELPAQRKQNLNRKWHGYPGHCQQVTEEQMEKKKKPLMLKNESDKSETNQTGHHLYPWEGVNWEWVVFKENWIYQKLDMNTTLIRCCCVYSKSVHRIIYRTARWGSSSPEENRTISLYKLGWIRAAGDQTRKSHLLV